MPESLRPIPPEPTDQAAALETRIGQLPAQRLKAGECATFLWERNAERKLVFFSDGADDYARMWIDGRQQDIPRASAGGENVFGQSAKQRYVWRDLAVDIDLTFERRAGISGGALIPQGSLLLSNRDGWEYVLPVAGLVACGE